VLVTLFSVRGITKRPADLTTVPARLARLRERGGYGRVFGADSHQFRLNPPLTEAEVDGFERAHGVVLPTHYRRFLTDIGNGGAGPDNGVHKLGTTDEDTPWGPDNWPFVGELSAPFPHVREWNPVPFDPDKDDPDDEMLSAIGEEYCATKHVNGAIPICHRGCNLRYWLVISGQEAGHVWYDCRVDWRGLVPVPATWAPRATFADWYCDWLVEAEQKLGVTGQALPDDTSKSGQH
jgi:hypothetical protein